MKEIDLRRNLAAGRQWWLNYLASLASTPRNWIECLVEPSRWDLSHEQENNRLANNYPAEGLCVWWTIVCLDGAPERVKHWLGTGLDESQAIRRVAAAEERFRGFIEAGLQRLLDEPVARIIGNWCDGVIIGNGTNLSAKILVSAVARKCRSVNEKESLEWPNQYHVRAGLGLTIGDAFQSLLVAQRDEMRFVIADPWTGTRAVEILDLSSIQFAIR